MREWWQGVGLLEKVSLVLAAVLLVCLCPMPYGFYTVVRLSVAIVAGCWAYRFYEAKKMALTIVAGGVVVFFQPLFKIVLDRVTWNILDVILAILLVLLVLTQNRQPVKD